MHASYYHTITTSFFPSLHLPPLPPPFSTRLFSLYAFLSLSSAHRRRISLPPPNNTNLNFFHHQPPPVSLAPALRQNDIPYLHQHRHPHTTPPPSHTDSSSLLPTLAPNSRTQRHTHTGPGTLLAFSLSRALLLPSRYLAIVSGSWTN